MFGIHVIVFVIKTETIMQISSRHYGGSGHTPSSIIEITVSDFGSSIVADVLDLNRRVDQGFINDLENILEELKEQNRLLDEKYGGQS